jgi:hypothetical protein
VLAPWWEDLTTDLFGVTGLVSYTTIGEAPNREFVVQWKNIRAFWESWTTTARINFQVRLREVDNAITYHYGPVVPGTFGASDSTDLGASIGFKDHVGGDLHFYDVISGGTNIAANLVTDLSPLTDWPGPDSCYVIQTIATGVDRKRAEIPETLTLFQNYPNPFNPSTTITYSLPEADRVSLKIYNALGQELRTLVAARQAPGLKSVLWDGRDAAGGQVSSGVYVYRLQVGQVGDIIKTRKMLVIK